MHPQSVGTWPLGRQAFALKTRNLTGYNRKRNSFAQNWAYRIGYIIWNILFGSAVDNMTKIGTADQVKHASQFYFWNLACAIHITLTSTGFAKNVCAEVTFLMMSRFFQNVSICHHWILKLSFYWPKLVRREYIECILMCLMCLKLLLRTDFPESFIEQNVTSTGWIQNYTEKAFLRGHECLFNIIGGVQNIFCIEDMRMNKLYEPPHDKTNMTLW